MESTLRDLGADDVSFDPIVASGPNAARPHHHPGDRRVEPGETFLVDAGCVVDGYCSDGTRTFATGSLPAELERAYAVCLDAQLATLAAVRPGAACVEVDAIARQILADEGYTVFHNVGHAVGLEIHEDPRLAKGSTDILEAGNVVTVEPGDLPAGPRRDQDRGPRDRHRRRPRGADAVHERAAPHGPGIGPDEVATARR